jgi:hypothetical protein
MGVEHFVGRNDAVKRVQDVLKGREVADSKLTVLSIEGPGGIGKTFLYEHAVAGVDLTDREYLTLRADGSDPSARTLVRAVARMVDGADAGAIRDRPSGYYFPSVDQVVKEIETIRSKAAAEFQRRYPNDENARRALLRFLDLAFEAGKRINDAIPITKKHIDFHELDVIRRLLEDTIPLMDSLREESAGFWECLGLGGSITLRNAIKENACQPLAEALVSDLGAILFGYEWKRVFKPVHSKIKGIDRLLFVLDDYEMLQNPLAEFLTGHLLPALKAARFQSLVIVIGRDRLEVTHPAWSQHFKPNLLPRVVLAPLSRPEMDQLVESYGVTAHEEKERAWLDTQGYPFYVQLWIEEVAAGARSAVMLKLVHDRTTRWMNDRQKGWLQNALFLDEVNVRTLRSMIGNKEEAVEAAEWFQVEGSVRDTTATVWRVRHYLRSRLVVSFR